MRKCFVLMAAALLVPNPLLAQDEGDHYTAGYSGSRTYLNSGMGSFTPPLTPAGSLQLNSVANASSLLVFENGDTHHLLVGQEAGAFVEYRLFSASDGASEWALPIRLSGTTGMHFYQPAYSNDIVLLGGATSTAVKAVEVSTGLELWEDKSVGPSNGRFPILTNGLALYHGQSGLRAVDPVVGPSGGVFFQRAVTTVEAPLSVSGQQGYLLTGSGTLSAFNTADGSEAWTLSGLSVTHPNFIATEKYLFLNTAIGALGALSAADGSIVWATTRTILSETPSMALAYGQLYLFVSDDGEGQCGLDVHDADTGNILWSTRETGTGVDFGTVVNNVVYYYNETAQRIQARDAFTGNLLWSHRVEGVRGLSFANSRLYALLSSRVDVFEARPVFYFAQIADGGGQRLLVSLSNPGSRSVNGVIEFFATDGSPLSLHVSDVGTTSAVDFTLAPGASTRIQTLGEVQGRAGWARVQADGRLAGSSIYQFAAEDGSILNEAGVADSQPTGQAIVYTAVALPPGVPAAIDTGIAIANPNLEAANVEITLLDKDGNELNQLLLVFGPGQQRAQFVTQLFPAETEETFTGSVLVRSDLPVIVTALRTQAGLQLSSYPVGQ